MNEQCWSYLWESIDLLRYVRVVNLLNGQSSHAVLIVAALGEDGLIATPSRPRSRTSPRRPSRTLAMPDMKTRHSTVRGLVDQRSGKTIGGYPRIFSVLGDGDRPRNDSGNELSQVCEKDTEFFLML